MSESNSITRNNRKPKTNAGIATSAQAESNLLKHKMDAEDEEDYSLMPDLIEEECDIPKRSKMYEQGTDNFSIADCVIFSDLCIGDDTQIDQDVVYDNQNDDE